MLENTMLETSLELGISTAVATYAAQVRRTWSNIATRYVPTDVLWCWHQWETYSRWIFKLHDRLSAIGSWTKGMQLNINPTRVAKLWICVDYVEVILIFWCERQYCKHIWIYVRAQLCASIATSVGMLHERNRCFY